MVSGGFQAERDPVLEPERETLDGSTHGPRFSGVHSRAYPQIRALSIPLQDLLGPKSCNEEDQRTDRASRVLNVHTIKTCAVGRWKSMGLDLLTISSLAHHKDIATTRRHYDFFDTGRILTAMNGGLDNTRANEESATLLLHSEHSSLVSDCGEQKNPESKTESGF
jgi:hypothetical protein